MMRLCRRVVLAGLALGAPARAQVVGKRDPSPIIFPQQTIPLSFSHKQHLALNLKCDYCHAKAPQSQVARDFLAPPEEVCTDCHAIERDKPNKAVAAGKPDAACQSCHPGFSGVGQPPRMQIPVPYIRFNHQVHVSRGVGCVHCHASVPQADLATRSELPRMPLCLTCHDNRQASARCTTCHIGDSEGRIQTTLTSGVLRPSGVLRGDTHDVKFRTDHRRVAANDSKYCENCHRTEFCLACHNGVVKPLDFHGNDYLSLHAGDARRNQPDCSSCHRLQTFCLGCHQRSGVALPRDALALPKSSEKTTNYNPFFRGSRKFHPSGWVMPPRGPDHHSIQAQRNINACVSCHREETCLACHSSDTLVKPKTSQQGINPHPSNFIASQRCKSLAGKNPRACLKCHASSDPARQCKP